ncbi:uncharacterized protein [Arachis hypogaea]|uniref:uncharacterized protein n=1 Tax=Arachis hypogaea TaxID=3818 RepID=UPI000DECBE60|nr:uncharacterized protein LOC112737782 isoform X1 [Arachis hypogaea]
MGKTLRHPVAGLLAASVTVVARKREGAPLILSLPLRLAVVGSLAAVHKVVPVSLCRWKMPLLPSPKNSAYDPPELLAATRAVAGPVRNRSYFVLSFCVAVVTAGVAWGRGCGCW